MSTNGFDMAPADPVQAVRPATYGRNFSYFSHRIFVTYFPEELHEYLHQLLTLEPGAANTSPPSKNEAADRIEIELVRWVLLHRSQLNPLALNRLIEAWRGPGDELRVPAQGGVRSDREYRVDITIQFALELELATAQKHWLVQTRPRLQLALLDAAYYVTRQWMDFNRPEGGGRPDDDEQNPVLDLSADKGFPEFKAYLVHRMNLHEDTDFKPASKPVSDTGDAPPPEPAPLNDREYKWLFGIALGIAKTLSPAASRNELQRRWEEVEKDRKSSIPPAGQALFDALLTEDESVLMDSEDGSSRYPWRPPPRRDMAAMTPREIARETATPRKRIAFIARTLQTAMTSADKLAPAVHPLQMLSDRYRILPTTPAWERVEAALKSMQAAQGEGQGNPDALASDSEVLHQYAALLASDGAASAVVQTLVIGAALAGMKARSALPATSGAMRPPGEATKPDGMAWDAALQAISDGLLLENSNLSVAQARLGEAYKALGGWVTMPSYPQAANSTGGWLTSSQLDAVISAAFLAGKAGKASQPGQPAQAELAGAAWGALQTRLLALARDGAAAPQVADAVELICAVRHLGPSPALPLRLDRISYRQWTKLLVTSLKSLGGQKQASEIPVTVIAHAAERLGMRALSEAAQQRWTDGLSMSTDQRKTLRQYVEHHLLWHHAPRSSGPTGPARLALVVGTTLEPQSITDGWPQPPQGGVVMALTAGEIDDLLDLGLTRWVQALEQALVLAWEPGMEGSADESRLRRTAPKLGGSAGVTEVWLYRSPNAGSHVPSRIDPTSAEELWVEAAPPR